jgi:hypothetical protein
MCIATSFYENFNMRRYVVSLVGSHFVTWGISMINLIILSLLDTEIFGDVGTGFCWISKNYYFLRFSMYYVWIFICWIFNLIVLILVTIELLRRKYSDVRMFSKLSGRVALYSAVFLICWIPGFSIRVFEIFDHNIKSDLYFLGLIHLFSINTISFYIAIIFIYSENILREYGIVSKKSKSIHLNVMRISSHGKTFETSNLIQKDES